MRLFLVLALLAVSFITYGQDCSCCTPQHAQFDFWVGQWNVFDTTGKQVGQSSITKLENECVVFEQWKGGKGYTGTSMNYYDKTDSTWNQVWVDQNGDVLKFKGRYTGKRMVLRGPTLTHEDGQKYFNQISWWRQSDGSVVQFWQAILQDKSDSIVIFKGIYRLKKS